MTWAAGLPSQRCPTFLPARGGRDTARRRPSISSRTSSTPRSRSGTGRHRDAGALGDLAPARSLLARRRAGRRGRFVPARALRASFAASRSQTHWESRPARVCEAFEAVSREFAFARLGDGGLGLAPTATVLRAASVCIVARVLDAQVSGAGKRLKACRKEGCGWLFYDGSRNGSSSWCSM